MYLPGCVNFLCWLPIITFESVKCYKLGYLWILAGWVLSAYFLGGYGEDGRGVNGLSQAVIAAAKSWIVGIPVSSLTLHSFEVENPKNEMNFQ